MTEQNRAVNVAAEVAKGRASLAAAERLLELDLFDDAVSRFYYAAFHFASAALLVLGIEATSPRALLTLFSQHLVHPGHLSSRTGRALGILSSTRNQADYDRHFLLDRDGALEEAARARALIAEIESYLVTQGHAG